MSTVVEMNKGKDHVALAEQLNKQVANWSVLYMKLHHFHWYVTGTDFFVLHEKFEELYNEATLIMDELAERVLTIGGQPLSTLKEQMDAASIKEAKKTKKGQTAQEMVRELIDDLTQLAAEASEVAALAEKAGDEPTADMLIGKQASIEKTIWMLRAYNA